MVQSGSVEISKTIDDKKFLIDIMKPGDLFGELGFIYDMDRSVTARAVGETVIGVVDREFMDFEWNKLSSEFRTILIVVAHRLKKTTQRASGFYRRTETRFPKVLSLKFEDRDSVIEACSGNISTGGLFIKTENPLQPGRRFLLKLEFPGVSKPLEIECGVAWVQKQVDCTADKPVGMPTGMGVKFCGISKEDRGTLGQYIESLRDEKEAG